MRVPAAINGPWRFLIPEPTAATFEGSRDKAIAVALLLVEDDVLIRMLLSDMLGEIGYTIAAEAGSVDEALEATRKTDFDLAILDADLGGRSVSPVADALVARDIGFVFVTGSDHELFAYRARPTLMKPFQIDALKRCCTSALSSH